MAEIEYSADEDEFIAVVGMAGRFPGAVDVDEFWRNLAAGLDTIDREPARIIPGGAADGGDQEYVPARGRLDAAEWFDAEYFGYSAREAFLIDPQHRVFLETAVAALENAGQDPDRFPGSIGVYGGSTETQYAQALRAQQDRLPGLTEDEILLGTAPDFLTARTAERLGLRGPAVAVQAACATALVAVHTAGRALLAGDCDLALAGGVAVHVPPKKIAWTGGDGTLAPDGTCRTFDARGAGTVASNGVGVVVLKRFSDALADGDHIRAVLRGSAVTNDGAHRIGFGAPSVEGQAAAVRDAQVAAGTDARTITYIEAHGTATPLGDPIEMAALTTAFRADTEDTGFCAIGSVKTNIGHADAAAGAAGLIKTLLALEHGQIPPSLHFAEPNPQIDFTSSPFRVATELTAWEPCGPTRRAGVSSFAVGGVNAHLVLEEAPARAAEESDRTAQLLVFSARTTSALQAGVDRLSAHLAEYPGLPAADVAWTLQQGRREHEYRAFAVAGEDGLQELVPVVAAGPARRRPVVLLFPGQPGPAEAWRLHASEPALRRAFTTCLDAVDPELAALVRKVARGGAWPADPAVRDVYVFALEYSLAALWHRWGVRPAEVSGTGVGALVAATVAGAFEPADALRLVVANARAGQFDEVPEVTARPLTVPVVLGGEGRRYDAGAVVSAERWAREAREADRDGATAHLLADHERILLQVGFGSALVDAAREHESFTPAHTALAAFPERELNGADALETLYAALGRLWAEGTAVDWAGVHDGERRAKLPLPGYAFERLPYLVRHPADGTTETAWTPGAPALPASGSPDPFAEVGADTGAGQPAEVEEPAPTGVGPADGTPLAFVLRLFGQALGLDDIEPDESFFDLGGDSLIGAKLLAEIREAYPVDIKARSLFLTPTAAGIADLIERQLVTPLAFVLRLFGQALGLDDIEPDESFFDLGGDSLIGAKLLAEIREAYPVDIKARSLFLTPTAAGIADLIERQLADGGNQHSTDKESR
ncbi:type I polyketide synthase [Kitasatospora sp. NPDC001175]|uniref:type I polyketide synthase n=1 Tax=Kitasatospora sp. NPDC001175 TaxID=3157103 RepID=UPI003D0348FE